MIVKIVDAQKRNLLKLFVAFVQLLQVITIFIFPCLAFSMIAANPLARHKSQNNKETGLMGIWLDVKVVLRIACNNRIHLSFGLYTNKTMFYYI